MTQKIEISDTLMLLLRTSKNVVQTDFDFSFKYLQSVLGEAYHPEMKIMDIVTVMSRSYVELLKEPRFQAGQLDANSILELLRAPAFAIAYQERKLTVDADSALTLEQFHLAIVLKMWTAIQCSAIGWCREQVFPE